MLRPSDAPRRLWLGEREVADGRSTFGAPLSGADDLDLAELLAELPGRERLDPPGMLAAIERDFALALASRRWSLNDDGYLMQTDTRFVPGDITAMRSSAMRSMAQAFNAEDEGGGERDGSLRRERLHRVITTADFLYAATPYWLRQPDAWSMMASKPLTQEDRDAIVLPGPVLVAFDSGMEITHDYLELDLRLVDRVNYDHDQGSDPDGSSPHAGDHSPFNLRGGTLDLLRHHAHVVDNPDDPVPLFSRQLIGVLLLPTEDGSLSDVVLWLLRKIDPPFGATTEQIVSGGLTATTSSSTFVLNEGRLSRSTLAPIVESLAAVVAWGSWSPPSSTVTTDPTDREFRKVSRTSRFRRDEARGAFAGVQVLDSRQTPTTTSSKSEEAGTSVRTHVRAGHWKRVRVGAKTDWHYERRRIAPVIVNEGQDPIADLVRVYRLPPPPSE